MTLLISDISKKYGKHLALDHFDAELTGGIYGLLGPNGAGKTTLINIIVGLVSNTSGCVVYDGADVKATSSDFLNKIGFLPQHPGFYQNYTVQEFLVYMATVKGLPRSRIRGRIDAVLKTVNLMAERNKKIGACSGGMRQRLGIAQAMLNDPAILILDEPTAGLDPMERIRFRNLISQLSENRIVILATHIVPDVEYIANEVILIGAGRKIRQAKAIDLMRGIEGHVWELEAETEAEVQRFMRQFKISNVIRRSERYWLRVVSGIKPSETAINIPPSLEDVYLHYFGAQETG